MPGAWAGTRRVLVARLNGEVAGTVQVDLAMPSNQQHRAEIGKLMVHPDFRRKGLARALMIEAEKQARAAGRKLLTLDTRTGDAAEALFVSLAYQVAGVIPGYARGPQSPALESSTIFFKELG